MSRGSVCVEAGEFRRIYDPSVGEDAPWYINDHCFIRGEDGLFHLFGITHPEPADPMDEKSFAHATAPQLAAEDWTRRPPALHADLAGWGETHLWAPHVVAHAGRYWMFYCAGGGDHERYRIHLAISADLGAWTRHPANPIVVDGFDARDPHVLADGDRWILYYTATLVPSGGPHVVVCRTSADLVTWGERQIAFCDVEEGTFGGPTESPFVLRRGATYYLLICNNDRRGGYRATDVYRSASPLSFRREDRVGTIPAHAAEVVRDVDGAFYVSHCGWGQGGVHLARLRWDDGEDERDTSLPPPVPCQTLD